jgi:LacI family transcriptional regulator
MGRTAVELLLEAIDRTTPESRQVIFQPELVTRGSTL